MLKEKDLEKLGVLNWSDLSRDFMGADLLLGNGFSLNLSERFSYKSLFEEFLTNCSRRHRRIFGSFQTTSFEFILEKLTNAKDVNQVFKLETNQIEDAIEHLKDGLIKTIQDIHPSWAETDQEQLERIAMQINRFNNIFTLNYDLFLYRIVLILNDKHRQGENVGQYSDYFWEPFDAEFLYFDSSKEFEGYKHPYYLHGALFLFKESFYDLKLRRADDSQELIELISKTVQEGRIPLFVSEGTPEQKEEAINRSSYLRFALDKLKDVEKSLVIFGISLSNPDKHIVKAINQNRKDLAASIHVGTKSEDQVKSQIYEIKSKFARHKVKFFNSETLFNF